MGPAATARLNERIIAQAQRVYGAVEDDEFPEMITISMARPYLDHTGINPSLARQTVAMMIQHGIHRLERAGADIMIVACNTVHQPDIFQNIRVADTSRLLSITDAVADEAMSTNVARVGVIASEDSIRQGVYDDALGRRGCEVINVSQTDQQKINGVIHRAMGGQLTDRDTWTIQRVHDDLVARGAEATILGCTELALLYDELSHDGRIIDSIEIAAKTMLLAATERKRDESLQFAIG